MPAPKVTDDIALAAQAIAGIARLLIVKGLLRACDITPAAVAAGLSEAQAGQFARGELTLAPHQTLTLVNAALERLRIMQVSAAELRTAQAPKPVTAESVQGAVKDLAKTFPSWSVSVDGMDTVTEFGGGRLIWRASATDEALHKKFGHGTGWHPVSARDERELREKLTAIEAHLAHAKDQRDRYSDGRGVTRR
jgi:hypothetical protein